MCRLEWLAPSFDKWKFPKHMSVMPMKWKGVKQEGLHCFLSYYKKSQETSRQASVMSFSWPLCIQKQIFIYSASQIWRSIVKMEIPSTIYKYQLLCIYPPFRSRKIRMYQTWYIITVCKCTHFPAFFLFTDYRSIKLQAMVTKDLTCHIPTNHIQSKNLKKSTIKIKVARKH